LPPAYFYPGAASPRERPAGKKRLEFT